MSRKRKLSLNKKEVPGSSGDVPMDVLLATEYHPTKRIGKTRKRAKSGSENDSDDWEELDENTCAFLSKEISVKPVSRGLSTRDSIDQDIHRYVNLLWKRFSKAQAIALRKVHMLCCLGRGLFLSRACDYFYIRGFALSVVPHELSNEQGIETVKRRKTKIVKSQKSWLDSILKWYRSAFSVRKPGKSVIVCNESVLELFANKQISSRAIFLQGLVSVFRALNISARLLMRFSPKVVKATETFGHGTKPRPKQSVTVRGAKENANEPRDKYLSLQIVPFECSSDGSFDCWIEVFDADEGKWMPVDPYSLNICKPETIENMLNFSSRTTWTTFTVAYTLAFGPNGHIVDVTPRYASKSLHTSTRKERGIGEIDCWWLETLQPYKTSGMLRDSEEKELAYLSSTDCHPVPSTVSELQLHPLYVLARHIHKYEAIYPPDAQPVAKVHGESVFLRVNVQQMHTEGKWLQEGRMIKPGEEPYKQVPGHKKPRKPDLPVLMSSLYGEWQTELFKPPPVVDDKVPRNKFGNYEFFKPWMLPAGTCHIKLPGAQIIARRLGIDYAPTMTGWDFHGGVNHPVKYRAELERAWRDDQQASEITKETRKTERTLMNWRRIVKALLLGERLRQRYL